MSSRWRETLGVHARRAAGLVVRRAVRRQLARHRRPHLPAAGIVAQGAGSRSDQNDARRLCRTVSAGRPPRARRRDPERPGGRPAGAALRARRRAAARRWCSTTCRASGRSTTLSQFEQPGTPGRRTLGVHSATRHVRGARGGVGVPARRHPRAGRQEQRQPRRTARAVPDGPDRRPGGRHARGRGRRGAAHAVDDAAAPAAGGRGRDHPADRPVRGARAGPGFAAIRSTS